VSSCSLSDYGSVPDAFPHFVVAVSPDPPSVGTAERIGSAEMEEEEIESESSAVTTLTRPVSTVHVETSTMLQFFQILRDTAVGSPSAPVPSALVGVSNPQLVGWCMAAIVFLYQRVCTGSMPLTEERVTQFLRTVEFIARWAVSLRAGDLDANTDNWFTIVTEALGEGHALAIEFI
jgi:hypothetical protein